MSRQSLFALHAEVCRTTGPDPAWTLIELLRSANGHAPLGESPTARRVFELHAAAYVVLGPGPAWTLMELLRERNGDRLPSGEPWPDGFSVRRP